MFYSRPVCLTKKPLVMKKSLWIGTLFISLLFSTFADAQIDCMFNNDTGQWEAQDGGPCVQSIITAVPILRIASDARSNGLGSAGIALSSDANAIHFNESKLAFSKKDLGFAMNYQPWHVNNNDIHLFHLTGYKKMSDVDAVGVSFRYLSLGKIEQSDSTGMTSSHRAKEMDMEIAYARQLSKNLSVGFGVKYILSDLAGGQQVGNITIGTGKSFAMDASLTYTNNKIRFLNKPSDLTIGLALTNFGQKISYTASLNKDFIPTNLGLGTSWKINPADNHSITFVFDVNKLLVPTPSNVDEDGIDGPDYRSYNSFKGALRSFSDAPSGSKEELNELQFAMGIEYWFQEKWALRGGYFSEHETKGNNKYFTAGLGTRIKNMGVDVSMEFPQTRKRDFFQRTLRLTLMYDFKYEKETS